MNNINYETIEQYLNGELSGEALLAFEDQLKTDAALAAEVKLYRSIQDELKQQQNSEAAEALTHTLRGLNEKHFAAAQKKPAPVRKLAWMVAAAAAAVIIAFILIVNPFKNNNNDNEQLFAEYAQPEALHLTERGNEPGSVEEKAEGFYNQQAYEKALPLLKQMLEKNRAQPVVQIAIGICQVYTGDYKSAIENFDQLASGKSSYAPEAIKWKGLAQLKQGKKTEAIETLQRVPPGDLKVKELLEKLQR